MKNSEFLAFIFKGDKNMNELEKPQEEIKRPPTVKATTEQPSVVKELGKYVMDEYIAPKTKDILHDMFAGLMSAINDGMQGAINKIFYGEDNGVRKTSSGGTSYNSFYRSASSAATSGSHSTNIARRSSTEVQIVYVDTEQDARDLVSWMQDTIQNYGKVKVSDLYQSLTPKIPVSFQDVKYGWTNPNEIGYHKVYAGEHRNQFQLDMPKPIDITGV